MGVLCLRSTVVLVFIVLLIVLAFHFFIACICQKKKKNRYISCFIDSPHSGFGLSQSNKEVELRYI